MTDDEKEQERLKKLKEAKEKALFEQLKKDLKDKESKDVTKGRPRPPKEQD